MSAFTKTLSESLSLVETIIIRKKRFWVGGTGNSNDTAHWSLTSGGASGASVPDQYTDVFFDANSFSGASQVVTINAAFTCQDFNWTGATNTPTLAGSSGISCYGSVKLIAGMVATYSGQITFLGTTTGLTLDTAGLSLAMAFYFNSDSGSWAFASTITTTAAFQLDRGTLDTAGFNVNAAAFFSSGFNGQTFYLRSSTLTFTGFFSTGWSASSGMTIVPGTSIIKITGSAFFEGRSLSYYELQMLGTGGPNAGRIFGSNQFTNLKRITSANYDQGLFLDAGSTTTVTGTLTITGDNAIQRCVVETFNAVGSAATINAAAVALTNADFRDITAGGAAAPWTGTVLGNRLGNTNITFTSPVTRYWVLDSGDFNDTGHWSATSGGASGVSVPLPQDTVIFDANSFLSTGQVLTLSGVVFAKDFTATNIVNLPVIDISGGSLEVYGSFTMDSSAQFLATVSTGSLYFYARSSVNLRTGGNLLPVGVTINMPGGTLVLQDNLLQDDAYNSGIRLTAGTFNANDFSLTVNSFWAPDAGTRAIQMGAGVWNIKNKFDVGVNPGGLTITPGTSVVTMTNTNPAISSYFRGGGKTFNNLNIVGGPIQIQDSSTFNVIIFSAGGDARFENAKTQTISNLVSFGTSGNGVSLLSMTPGSQFTLSCPSGTIIVDYATIQDSVASGGATFKARFSTNGGNNSGWIFFTQYLKTLSDSMTIADTIAKIRSGVINIVESLSLTEVFIKGPKHVMAETITLVENFAKNFVLLRVFSETLTITQAFSKSVVRTITESIALTEIFTKIGTFVRTLTESLGLVELFTASKTFTKVLFDVISTSDTIVKIHGYIRTLTETITLTATIVARIIKLKILTDTILMVDRLLIRINGRLTALFRRVPKATKAGITRIPKNSSDWDI